MRRGSIARGLYYYTRVLPAHGNTHPLAGQLREWLLRNAGDESIAVSLRGRRRPQIVWLPILSRQSAQTI